MTRIHLLSLATDHGARIYEAVCTAERDFANAYSEEGERIEDIRAELADSYKRHAQSDDELSAYVNAYCDLIIGARRESACICGPDHDCRSTGCDENCPACC